MASPNETEYLTERDTVKRLKHLGRKLLTYNGPLDKLLVLELLDKLELVLSTVNHSPTQPIQASLVPSMKALISDELLRHTDEDVKISVTSCIAEITRIAVPDTPYDDEQMKEIFKLMVAAFGKLSDVSGRRYEKTLAILDNVAKIRLCLVMLDLECDDLVIEMFLNFLSTIRSNHPHRAIDCMESIMTLVLDESEEVSSELLRPLLDSLRKEKQAISPISWTLAEKVVTNSAVKLKPYLMRAVESSGRALDEYAQIVTSICHNGPEPPQRDHSNDSNKAVVEAVENELDVPKDAHEQPTTTTTKLDVPKDADAQPCHVNKELELDITCVRGAEIIDDTNSNIRSADCSSMDVQIIKKSGSQKKRHSDLTMNSKSSNGKANSETVSKNTRSDTQLNTVSMKRGRKPNSLMNAEEGYNHSWIHMGKKTGKPTLSRKNDNSSSVSPHSENAKYRKDKMQSKPKNANEAPVSQLRKENIPKPAQDVSYDFSPCENPTSSKENVMSKHEDISERLEAFVSKPKTDNNTVADAPSTKLNIPDRSHTKRGRPSKIISRGNQDVDPNTVPRSKGDNLNPRLKETSSESPGVWLKRESEVRKDSEVKPHTSIRKIKFTLKSDKKTAVPSKSVVAEIESKVSCEDKEKHKLGKNIAENRKEARSSLPQKEVKKRRLNAIPNKDLNTSSAIEASQTEDLFKSLVGSRIEVWWPEDSFFYAGVVGSYHSAKKKHRILYDDGDIEILNLKKERWKMIADVSSDEEQGHALHKLAEASDIAQKSDEKSKLELAKGVNINSKSRSGLDNDSKDDPPRTVSRLESLGKHKTKRMKTGSAIRKKKPKIEGLLK